MRILLVSDFLPPVRGGLENHVAALASGLAQRGHDVRAATLTTNPDPIPGVPIHSIAAGSRYLPHANPDRPFHAPVLDPAARIALGRIVSDFRPDVIHGHSPSTLSVPHRAAPIVFTAHDYGLICGRRTLLRHGTEACSGPAVRRCIECTEIEFGRPAATFLTLGTRSQPRRLGAAAVIAVSHAVAARLKPALSVPVEVIPNFIGAEPPLAATAPGLPSGPFVLYAGDPSDHKGIPDLLAIWSQPSPPPIPLVLATTRPLPTTDLPAQVSNVSLRPDQVVDAWNRASIAVIPSWWDEPCPTVALEAMRAGVPVVAYAVGGLPDLIRDDVDGYLVRSRDRAALAARLHELVADDAKRAAMAEQARAGVRPFTAEVVIDRIVSCYQRVVTDRSEPKDRTEVGV